MASDVSQGDAELAYLTVSPADSDTQVTLTVHPPAGASYPIVMTGGPLEPVAGSSDQQQRWTADTPVEYSTAGRWVLAYEVTGTGEGAEDLEVYVVASPVAGGPTWWPGRSRVAAYVPHRTLIRSTGSVINSQDQYLMSWDSTTTPTGIQVDRLIADGAAWVSARVPNLATSLSEAASVCVSLYAAAMIERSWPDDDQSLQRANDLERRLDAQLQNLADASNALDESGDYGVDVSPMPQWSFPAADPRWDYSGYW